MATKRKAEGSARGRGRGRGRGGYKRAKVEEREVTATGDEKTFQLSAKRKITVRTFKDMVLVDIREYWQDAEGKTKPGNKGISLTADQWGELAKQINEINAAVKALGGGGAGEGENSAPNEAGEEEAEEAEE